MIFIKSTSKKVDKKKLKLKKDDKMFNFKPEDTFSLSEKYKYSAEFDRQRMMFTLQSLFNALAVIPSFDKAGPLSYKSDKWETIYKNRTSTERINNRVLNNYNLQHMRIRNKDKNTFFAIMAGINIHLDAWLKVD